MFKKYKKYLTISLIVLISVIFISLLSLFYYFKDYIFNEVGDYLGKLLKVQQVVVEIKSNSSGKNSDEDLVNVIKNSQDSILSIVTTDSKVISSAVVLSEDGLLVTTNDSLNNFSNLFVLINNQEKYPLKKVYEDKNLNLALIKIETSKLKTLNLIDFQKVSLGQKIIVLGKMSPSGSVSSGIVESLNELIRTDIPVNSELIGGAVISSKGELIGINVSTINSQKNIFASPITKINELIADYKKSVTDQKPQVAGVNNRAGYLGIGFYFKELKAYVENGQPIGPIIDGVVPNSPAQKSGLQIGDIIVSIDGKEFSDEAELTDFIRSCHEGQLISLKIYRRNQVSDLSATCGVKN